MVMDRFLNLTLNTALTLLILMFWVMVVGGIFIGVCVLLHAFGMFTCDTVWCS